MIYLIRDLFPGEAEGKLKRAYLGISKKFFLRNADSMCRRI